jgi:hypothetical protein
VDDTLGLLEECLQLARDSGYEVREEPLGDLRGGACAIAGRKAVLVNAELPAAERLALLVELLAADPAAAALPTSRLLALRLRPPRAE